MLSKLPNAEGYAKFAYHVNLLKEFTLDDDRDGSMRRRGSFRGSSAKVARDSSIRSAGSMRGRRASTTSSSKRRVSVGAAVNTSIHTGGGVFQEWKKKDGSLHNPRKNKNIQRSVSLSKMT
uniref:Uncharacterized protein n=1 Tax=Craspedostauros australis TaxID=1486917 RepID=A0A7R9ZRG9_9STRA|mmetsp:Transcript_7036/g.19101  ORF Transcript_7036/g.19101 Transcript_7036/m.19101 type:complete len:121 (+) Transcript_7036:191-553(+)